MFILYKLEIVFRKHYMQIIKQKWRKIRKISPPPCNVCSHGRKAKIPMKVWNQKLIWLNFFQLKYKFFFKRKHNLRTTDEQMDMLRSTTSSLHRQRHNSHHTSTTARRFMPGSHWAITWDKDYFQIKECQRAFVLPSCT